MSKIKIKRALAAAKVGRFPATASAMLDQVPTRVVSKLASHELAELLDSFDACARWSKTLHERAIINDGVIWDSGRGCFREIAA